MSATSAITYRVSSLGRSLQVAARAWRVVAPTILINAVLQAALVAPGIHPEFTPGFLVSFVISYALLVLAFVVTTAALLAAIDGSARVGVRQLLGRSWKRFAPTLLWSIALVAVVTIGLSFYLLPGLIILALFPVLLIAVVDARRNPVMVNFRVIRHRFWRWLLTVAIMGAICGVLWLLATVNAFFIAGPLGALIAWMAFGLIATWFIGAWALIYRSVKIP